MKMIMTPVTIKFIMVLTIIKTIMTSIDKKKGWPCLYQIVNKYETVKSTCKY